MRQHWSVYWIRLVCASISKLNFHWFRAFMRSAIHLASAKQGNTSRAGEKLAEWMRMQISKVAIFVVGIILVCVSLIVSLFIFITSRSNAASTCRFDFHPDQIFCCLRKVISTHPESSFKPWFARITTFYCETRLQSFPWLVGFSANITAQRCSIWESAPESRQKKHQLVVHSACRWSDTQRNSIWTEWTSGQREAPVRCDKFCWREHKLTLHNAGRPRRWTN